MVASGAIDHRDFGGSVRFLPRDVNAAVRVSRRWTPASRTWRALRWSTALVTAAASVAFLVISRYAHALQICSVVTTTPTNESTTTVRSCAPLSFGWTDWLPVIVVILLLVAPDFARIKVPGIIELDRLGERVSRQTEEIQRLQANVQQVQQVVHNSAQATTNVFNNANEYQMGLAAGLASTRVDTATPLAQFEAEVGTDPSSGAASSSPAE